MKYSNEEKVPDYQILQYQRLLLEEAKPFQLFFNIRRNFYSLVPKTETVMKLEMSKEIRSSIMCMLHITFHFVW